MKQMQSIKLLAVCLVLGLCLLFGIAAFMSNNPSASLGNTPAFNKNLESSSLIASSESHSPSNIDLQQSKESEGKSQKDNPLIGIDTPVAYVSEKYAADAQRMLDDFYSAADMIPQEYLTAPFDPGPYMSPDYSEETKCQFYDQWCYKSWGIDYYFYTWEEAADELRNGKTLYEVLEFAEESTREFYNSKQCPVGVLYGLNGNVFGEARYDDGERNGTIFGVMAWYFWEQTGPVTALVLTDDLMSALENEGFDLSQTRATSVAISGHSGGLYFDDGIIQRYYPQIMLSGQDNFPALSNHVFYSTEALIESLGGWY